MSYAFLSRGIAAIGASILFASTILAGQHTLGALTIADPWARATDPLAKTSAAYFTVTNRGGATERLVAAAADVADEVGLHRTVSKNGMLAMEHVDGIAVPSGGAAELKPGGYHVMFIGLKRQLKAGETFPLHLTFEKAGRVTVQVAVRTAAGGPSTMGGHGDMKSKDMGGMKH
jgi:hypothetical protein